MGSLDTIVVFRVTRWENGASTTVEARCRSGPSITTRVEQMHATPSQPIRRPAVIAPRILVLQKISASRVLRCRLEPHPARQS